MIGARRRRASRRPSCVSSIRATANLLPRPQQEAPRAGIDAGPSRSLIAFGTIHCSGASQPRRHPRGHGSPSSRSQHTRGDVTPPSARDIGGLGAVQEVAGGEQPRTRRPQARVHDRPAGSRVELGAREHRELVVGDPVGCEHDEVALDRLHPPGVELGQLDRLDARHAPRIAGHGGPGAASGTRKRAAAPARNRAQRLMARQLGRHRHGARTAVREGQQGREGDVLGADDDGPGPDPLTAPGRRAAAACPSSSRPAAACRATRRAERGRSRHPVASTTASAEIALAPRRPGELEGAVGRPAGDLGSEPQLGARRRSRSRPSAPRTAGPDIGPTQVAQAEALVAARGAGCRPPLARARSRRPSRRPRGAARWPRRGPRGRRRRSRPPRARSLTRSLPEFRPAGRPIWAASSRATSAPQKKPWQRPISTRVRRRRPSRSRGGTGLAGGVADLAAGHALAEADDLAIRGIGGDPLAVAVAGAGSASPMFGIRISGKPAAALAQRQARLDRGRSRTHSAIAIEAVRPVDRMPPAHAYASSRVDLELVVRVLGGGAQPGVDGGHLVLEQLRHQALAQLRAVWRSRPRSRRCRPCARRRRRSVRASRCRTRSARPARPSSSRSGPEAASWRRAAG